MELEDGRDVVIKVRETNPRLEACHFVHGSLWASGFPYPQPLTPPLPFGDPVVPGMVASAEVYRPGGKSGCYGDEWLAERTATELRRLIASAPDLDEASLSPPPPWTGWLDRLADPWPQPDEGAPLNEHPAAAGLAGMARVLNECLRASTLPLVAGHADWYQGNLRWHERELFCADDWDSIAALPEAAHAGCSAVSYLPAAPGDDPSSPGAEIEDTARFLDAYAAARGTPFSDEEATVAWAAGLWQRTFDAAKNLAAGKPDRAADQIRDASQRLRMAGV